MVLLAIGLVISIVAIAGNGVSNSLANTGKNVADSPVCPPAFKFLTEIHKPKLYCYSELRYATGEESTDPSNWCRRDSKFEGKSQYNTCSEFPYMAPAPAPAPDPNEPDPNEPDGPLARLCLPVCLHACLRAICE